MKAICTGYENQGICAMCGGELPERRRAYCSAKCAELYEHLFFWQTASLDAFRRANRTCQRCGRDDMNTPSVGQGSWAEHSGMNVHHIMPLNGEDRTWHRLNMPLNLRVLCHDCHVYEHSKKYKLRCSQEVMEL